jgi:hypothetical protein
VHGLLALDGLSPLDLLERAATRSPDTAARSAAADGARVAAHLNTDLVAEDTDRAVARLTNAETVR